MVAALGTSHWCRLDREWQEKILKEREQMLSELEGVQQTAQAEIDRQQTEYQKRIQALNEEMVSWVAGEWDGRVRV